MTKITWAAASAIAALAAACTTDVVSNTNDGGISTGGGNGGASGSSTTGSPDSGSTGGSGGSSVDDGGSCMASAGASACEQCSYDLCKTETCACQADSDCKAGSNDFYTCLSGPAAGDGVHCGENFAGSAGPGAGKASDLGTCMLDKCLDRCQGRDAGPRH